MGPALGIYTVGHSTHAVDEFAALLRPFHVDTVVDVRSRPYSRIAPQFNRPHISRVLAEAGLGYVFMGQALGGRPEDGAHYDESGRALYYLMAQTDPFKQAIDLLIEKSREHCIALMCSEGRPEKCHRNLLVGRVLEDRGLRVVHVGPRGEQLRVQSSMSESFFPSEEDTSWKSALSVLQDEQPRISSPP